LKALDPAVEVYSRACPLFVPLVEEGWTDNQIVEMTVRAYLESLKPSGIDTLITGLHPLPAAQKSDRKIPRQRRQAGRFRRGDRR
jgi:glutamate racemase